MGFYAQTSTWEHPYLVLQLKGVSGRITQRRQMQWLGGDTENQGCFEEVITATYKEYLGKGHVDFPLGIYIKKGRTRSCGDVKKHKKTKR